MCCNCGECLEAFYGRGGGKVTDAVRCVARDLGDWSMNVLGDLQKRIKRVRKALEECRRGPVNEQSVGRMELLKFRLERLDEQEHIYWKQRAKVHWLEKGDRNTQFFHCYATERRKASRIRRLITDESLDMLV